MSKGVNPDQARMMEFLARALAHAEGKPPWSSLDPETQQSLLATADSTLKRLDDWGIRWALPTPSLVYPVTLSDNQRTALLRMLEENRTAYASYDFLTSRLQEAKPKEVYPE